MEELNRAERIAVEELSAQYGVSPATIRRDLLLLDQQGLLRRDRGGAVLVEPLFYEVFAHDSSFQEQVERYAAKKKRIGRAAAELIQDGETVAFSAGTTTSQVARCIPYDKQVTVFTNGVNMAMELGRRKNLNVILSGGLMRGTWFSLVGPATIEAAQRMIFDKLFLGVNGISAELGLTDFHTEEAAVNRAMLAHGRQVIVVVDHTKFDTLGTSIVGSLQKVNKIITDTGASPEKIRPFTEAGIDVLLA